MSFPLIRHYLFSDEPYCLIRMFYRIRLEAVWSLAWVNSEEKCTRLMINISRFWSELL